MRLWLKVPIEGGTGLLITDRYPVVAECCERAVIADSHESAYREHLSAVHSVNLEECVDGTEVRG